MEGRRRTGKCFVPGVGWSTKKLTSDRNYSKMFEDGAETWAFILSVWRWYPDLLLDMLRSPEADFPNEELIQRVMMRAYARYKYVSITGCRSLTKTNTKIKQKLAFNILWPKTKSSYYGPSYKQMAQIGSKTFAQIKHDYPVLAKHYEVVADAVDKFEIQTPHGSSFAISAYRGDNIHDVTAEEYAQEEQPAFDYVEYKRVVLPAIRLQHMVIGKPDPNFPRFQRHSITSAGRKQNHSYETRCKQLKMVADNKSAFVADVPWQVILLSLMRPYEWAESLKDELTPEEWMREMEALYTGADANPVIRDEVLTASQTVKVMETEHCCKDVNNKLKPSDVIYVVSYDVSYEDGAKNAKCAVSVLKLTKQTSFFKRDRYLKQQVYLEEWPPPANNIIQAHKIKNAWHKFSYDGSQTYLAIDGWQYGKSVIESLMRDLEDGLPPLCIYKHKDYTNNELARALPVIYPVKAGGKGVTDNDADMLRYAEIQFEQKNVELLTTNIHEGVDQYKKHHNIKDDHFDASIAKPYHKSRDLAGQIMNLKKVISGTSMQEKRISKHIQRDNWSALKYGLRFAQILEYENLYKHRDDNNEWEKEYEEAEKAKSNVIPFRGVGRRGGRFIG